MTEDKIIAEREKKKLSDLRLFLLDMDGTLYLGDHLFGGTKEFLHYILRIGGRYLFLTNNSSKSVDGYVKKLHKLGISAKKEDFCTSAQVTGERLRKSYAGRKIYVLGTEALKEEWRSIGIAVTERTEDDIACLVMGFDTELTFQKLEDACILLNRGVDYIATNPDLVCPTEYGYVPDCGSVAQMLYNATGRNPDYIGKPAPEMIYAAMEQTGFLPSQTVVVGDRIYTDIQSGLNAGIATVLVMSGETDEKIYRESKSKPHFVFADIMEFYRALQEQN